MRGDQRVSSQVAAQPGFIEEGKESLESPFTGDQQPHMIARLPDREVWIGLFDDSEGNTLALMSEPRL